MDVTAHAFPLMEAVVNMDPEPRNRPLNILSTLCRCVGPPGNAPATLASAHIQAHQPPPVDAVQVRLARLDMRPVCADPSHPGTPTPATALSMLCSKGCNPNAEDGAHTRNSALHLAAQVRPLSSHPCVSSPLFIPCSPIQPPIYPLFPIKSFYF